MNTLLTLPQFQEHYKKQQSHEILWYDFAKLFRDIMSNPEFLPISAVVLEEYCMLLLSSFRTCSPLQLEDIRIACLYETGEVSSQRIQSQIAVFETLKQTPQLIQRSPEWFQFRNDHITASALSKIVGMKMGRSLSQIISDKCGVKSPFLKNAAIMHGVIYEDVAVALYEQRNQTKVHDFGCVPHKEHSFLAASPDGISEQGIALEIKCPKSRKIKENIPDYYWTQVQLQMEVLELDRCDFLEVKLTDWQLFSDK